MKIHFGRLPAPFAAVFLFLNVLHLALPSVAGAAVDPTIDQSSLYTILDVAQNVSADRLKKAYRQLAMKYHPDRNPGNANAKDSFTVVTTAYEVLEKSDRRLLYDRGLPVPGYPDIPYGHLRGAPPSSSAGPAQGGERNPGVFSDPFEYFFRHARPALNLSHFKFTDMLNEASAYKRFVESISQVLNMALLQAPHLLDVFAADSIALRRLAWSRNRPVLMMIGAFAAISGFGFYMDLPDTARLFANATALALVLEEFAVFQTNRENKRASLALANAFAAKIEAWRGGDPYAAKKALFSFDVAKILAESAIGDVGTVPHLHYSRLNRILREFPLARHGLLLRVLAGSVSTAPIESALWLDMDMHPLTWGKVVKELNAMVGPRTREELERRLKSEGAHPGFLNPITTLSSRGLFFFHYVCERWLND